VERRRKGVLGRRPRRPLSGSGKGPLCGPEDRIKTAGGPKSGPQIACDSCGAEIVFGAGASRGVSCTDAADFASPLDSVFFDILKQLQASDFPENDSSKVG
jgi:hypothetical protein